MRPLGLCWEELLGPTFYGGNVTNTMVSSSWGAGKTQPGLREEDVCGECGPSQGETRHLGLVLLELVFFH